MSDQTMLPESFPDCQNPAIKGRIEDGIQAYYAKDFAKAMVTLQPLAHDPVAKCFLGLVYLDDPDQHSMRIAGWENLTASAEAGYEYAWYTIENRYLDLEKATHNLLQASRWFLKGAELGCITSQYSLGWWLCKLENYVEATKWLYLAVALGNTHAASLCESVSVNMTPEDYDHG